MCSTSISCELSATIDCLCVCVVWAFLEQSQLQNCPGFLWICPHYRVASKGNSTLVCLKPWLPSALMAHQRPKNGDQLQHEPVKLEYQWYNEGQRKLSNGNGVVGANGPYLCLGGAHVGGVYHLFATLGNQTWHRSTNVTLMEKDSAERYWSNNDQRSYRPIDGLSQPSQPSLPNYHPGAILDGIKTVIRKGQNTTNQTKLNETTTYKETSHQHGPVQTKTIYKKKVTHRQTADGEIETVETYEKVVSYIDREQSRDDDNANEPVTHTLAGDVGKHSRLQVMELPAVRARNHHFVDEADNVQQANEHEETGEH